MPSLIRLLLTLTAILASSEPARAQDPRFSLAVKGGVNAENSEDNIQGTTPALGVTGAIAFAHGWHGEVEFWLPQYIEDDRGNPEHRDIIFSFSAVKAFSAGRARPFVAVGLSLTRTQDWFTFCTAIRPDQSGAPGPVLVSCDEPDVIARRRERNDGKDGYLLAGGGVEWPLTRRLGIVADLRVSLAPVSVIVRPGVGVVFSF